MYRVWRENGGGEVILLVARFCTRIRSAPDRQLPEVGRTRPGARYRRTARRFDGTHFWDRIETGGGVPLGWVVYECNGVFTWRK